MQAIRELLNDFKFTLTAICFIIFLCTAGALINEQSQANIFKQIYFYRPCKVLITTRIIEDEYPMNGTSVLVSGTCFHMHGHPEEIEIGAPPFVNQNLWIGIIFGLVGTLIGARAIKMDSD